VNLRTPADQYVALLESVTVADRIIDKFGLIEAYDVPMRVDARRTLDAKVRVAIGKKDGLISVEVDDENPRRAAEIANRYVTELRELTARLALTEARQRREFFEQQLEVTKRRLTDAQIALETSGLSGGAIRTEPRLAADQYARARAEVTAAEVRLRALRSTLTESAPEVQRQSVLLGALRAQLLAIEASAPASGSEYISRHREYKYQESLFDLYARQFELAKADEAREQLLIQVVDAATPPERRSKPRRPAVALGSGLAGLALSALLLVGRELVRRDSRNPASAPKWQALRLALGRSNTQSRPH
jgi:uncharacterized protein involved in exopolysaccharide biosynthesis